MIELKKVSKKYEMGGDLIHALSQVDLKIKEGDFIAIMGPSGSGKSTLANVIGGLDNPDSGQVFIEEKDITLSSDNHLSEYRNKKIGFVFQNFNLHPHYTALENVALPMIFSRVSRFARMKRAADCLREVGLENRMKHKPNELSGGQRQRVCIARAIVNNPQIIIADEPTGNLDSQKGAEILKILKKLNREKNITLLVITHDPAVAKQADRIIHLYDGKLK